LTAFLTAFLDGGVSLTEPVPAAGHGDFWWFDSTMPSPSRDLRPPLSHAEKRARRCARKGLFSRVAGKPSFFLSFATFNEYHVFAAPMHPRR
jgi:hypothetical protein